MPPAGAWKMDNLCGGDSDLSLLRVYFVRAPLAHSEGVLGRL